MSARSTHPQSIAHGGLGTALHLAVAAHTDPTAATTLHHLLRSVGPVVDGDDACIYYGAPALAFVLHMAPVGYQRALEQLDDVNEKVTRARLVSAHARIDRGDLAAFAEYDIFRGLTGLTLLWLQRGTRRALIEDILTYLVRLTEPAADGRPGWRVWHRSDAFTTPGAHTNNGLAHGICGPLAVLALAWRNDITVPGHEAAIRRVLDHLDAAQRTNGETSWWDRWDTETRPSPPPLSWCYGTPGIARSQQLAALALNDPARRRHAEQVLLQHLDLCDPTAKDDLTVCHGTAGILRTCERIAADARNPAAFTHHIDAMRAHLIASENPPAPGLIDGTAGVHLTAQGSRLPWDASLALV